MIVVDASVVIELLLRTPAGRKVEDRLLAPEVTLHAPHLIDVEVAQVLRRFGMTGELDDDRAREALDDLRDLPLARYPHDLLLPRIWELRRNMTACDAAYVSLAELLSATLLTRDARLASAPGHHATIDLLQ